ncbi:MAG: UDP-3-O-(3-hydroxymyristoyl)glucosamine N-acyltransferase [Bacteroidetes bacterium]|nr:UDP-3-O-(3-hydroxymyristoyl)glucosamine N-acyltransferase [Bacteroidota bacterium]
MKLNQPKSLKQIAELIGAEYFGDAAFPITGINEIHKVTQGDLTFVDVAKYYKKALESAASVILINQKTEFPQGKSIIVSANPFDDYNKLVAYFSAPETPSQNLKNFYVQGDDVLVGDGTTIHAGTVLGNHIKIGDNCTIYPNVTIYDNTTIGDNVIIHANTVIGSHAFYYKNKKTHYEKLLSCGSVIIQNDVEIGAGCTIDKGVSGDTIIGEGSKLDNHIHIGHGVVLGKRVLIAAQCGIGGKAIIEDEVVIWGQVGITKDVTIGKGAVILAQSGVGKSLEGGKVYFGSPVQENRKALKDMVYLRRLDELFEGK